MDFFKIEFFKKIFPEYLRVSNILHLDQARHFAKIWVQTVCKGYHQTTKVATQGERVKAPSKIVEDDILNIFSQKIRFDISCESPGR